MRLNLNPLVAFLSLTLLSSCIGGFDPPNYTEYKPVLLSRESLEKSIIFHSAEPIRNPAKIYYKDNYIFISERFKGVHIIDNSKPSLPVNRGYIAVPGCVDMAIKENTLYVDNATDLLAVNLEDIYHSKVAVSKRIRHAFPELAPPDGRIIPEKYDVHNRPDNTVIIEWKK